LTKNKTTIIILSEGEGSKEHTKNSVNIGARDKPKKKFLAKLKKSIDK